MREVRLAVQGEEVVAVALRRELRLELLREHVHLLSLVWLVLVLMLVHI